MGRARHHFHCTDGRELVIDHEGEPMRSEARISSHAVRVAQDAKASCGGRFEWSGWKVDVHDGADRRVVTLAFRDLPKVAMAV